MLIDHIRQQIEQYALTHMAGGDVAHGWLHAHRVRNHALAIACAEGYPHLDRAETAALLHDIGLKHVQARREHGAKGAELAAHFLAEQGHFGADAIAEIAHAIHWHDSVRKDESPLLAILRDADMLELFGAVGIVRATQSRATAAEYDETHFPAETWGYTNTNFDARFAAGLGTGPTVIDQIAFHLSCEGNLNTVTAREMAKPLIEYMRAFVGQLVREVDVLR